MSKPTQTKIPPVSKFIIGKPIESLDELMAQEWICFDYCPSRHPAHCKMYHKGWFQNWRLRDAKRFIEGKHLLVASKAVEIPVHIIKSNPKM